MQYRYFHCPDCKTTIMAPKYKNPKKNIVNGQKHRKTMYCAICKKKQNFIQDEAFCVRY